MEVGLRLVYLVVLLSLAGSLSADSTTVNISDTTAGSTDNTTTGASQTTPAPSQSTTGGADAGGAASLLAITTVATAFACVLRF